MRSGEARTGGGGRADEGREGQGRPRAAGRGPGEGGGEGGVTHPDETTVFVFELLAHYFSPSPSISHFQFKPGLYTVWHSGRKSLGLKCLESAKS